MPPLRTSLLVPAGRLADVPVDLGGEQAAELLAAWTALWHPSLLAATGRVPGWHPADQPPEPDELQGELVVTPQVSRLKLPSLWCDQLRDTGPRNPPPVRPSSDRARTITAVLAAAGVDAAAVDAEVVRNFLALGYAYLQVELITRAMQYTSPLDRDRLGTTAVTAARAAVASDTVAATDGVQRAIDMLADARRHYYPADFYLVDVTLLAETTLGESLRAKLAGGMPTSVLASGELVERLARDHPETLRALREAVEGGTACVIGGLSRDVAGCDALSPQTVLAALGEGRQILRRCLGRDVQVFAQYHAAALPLLPEAVSGMGFTAALCAAFDGGRLPLADQVKTRWEGPSGASITALSAVPLDVGQAGTWLALGQRISDSLLRDHVATVLLAGWPAGGSEYYDDLRRVSRFGPVLGRLVTLEEYFAVTREATDWSSFRPSDDASGIVRNAAHVAPLVAAYRQDVADVHRRLSEGLGGLLPQGTLGKRGDASTGRVVVNPWSFAGSRYVGFDPLAFTPADDHLGAAACLPDVPGCGYKAMPVPAPGEGWHEAGYQETRHPHPGPLPKGEGTEHTLRNERLEVVIGAATGGIQSIRAHGDRGTRVSQRLVFHDPRRAARSAYTVGGPEPAPGTQMIADRIEGTRSDAVASEVTSHGRLVDAAGQPVAQFVQTVRLLHGASIVVVDVRLDAERPPEGASYIASRLAWRDEDAELRRGAGWIGRSARRRRIASQEWVEIAGSGGPITLFPLGLPQHERIGTRMLDTPLVLAGRQQGRFQFAIGLDCAYPTATALWLLTAGDPATVRSLSGAADQGWFLHVSARNLLVTHLEPLGAGREGLRARLLETEGRPANSTLSAYRPFRSARYTDFRGEPTGVSSVVDGRVHFRAGPFQWLQLEAEW